MHARLGVKAGTQLYGVQGPIALDEHRRYKCIVSCASYALLLLLQFLDCADKLAQNQVR